MFLAESADGLATVPALSHEPPPSYDAVLAMQEQQQRQQMLFRQHSPPPGYRSSLDLSSNNNNNNNNNNNTNNNTQSNNNSILLTTASYRQPSHSPTGNSNNLSHCGNMDALEAASSYNHNQQHQNHTVNNNNNMLQWKFCTLNNNNNNNNNSHNNNNSQLARTELMKKVLHAQSCCSLQRAEVESMWNAAAAAVAIRQNIQDDDLLHETCFMARKSLPSCSNNNNRGRATNSLTLCVLGQQTPTYRRGCPLCGKFRYDEAMSLSVSTESGLNDNIALEHMHEVNNINNAQNVQECACTQQNATEDSANVVYASEDLENGNTVMHGAVAASGASSVCEIFNNKTVTDDRDNNNAASTDLTSNATSSTLESAVEEGQQLNLISINENGIVRVDMSKIIDKTGLPTYEAALKLDSSGYV